jgi:biotin operon repressor
MMHTLDGRSDTGFEAPCNTARNVASALGAHVGNRLLRNLPAHDLRRLEPHLEIRTFARDEVIRRSHEMVHLVVFPHNMTISLSCTMADGTVAEAATVGSEGYLGVEGMLGSAVAITSAIAQQGLASVIPLDRVLMLADQIPSLRAAMLAYAWSYVAAVSRLAACNAVHNLKQRACRRILLTLRQTEQQSAIITQEELARALGASRTSINQTCKELRASNTIDYSRGRIRIKNMGEMLNTTCDCYSHLRNILF